MLPKTPWLIIPLAALIILLVGACASDEEETGAVTAAPNIPLPTDSPAEEAQAEQITPTRMAGGAEATPDGAPAAQPIPTPSPQDLVFQGKDLYADHCAACHEINGEGNGQTYPALNDNPFVTAQNPAAAVQTVLHGRNVMPGFGNALSERQIAAILSYVRTAWSNEAGIVQVAQIASAGTGAMAQAGATPFAEGDGGDGQGAAAMGEQIYANNCASCHQANGQGSDSYPALADNAFLTGDPTQVIETVLNGRGAMPAFKDTLSPEQIAAVISYERNSWGNQAPTVTPQQVRSVADGG